MPKQEGLPPPPDVEAWLRKLLAAVPPPPIAPRPVGFDGQQPREEIVAVAGDDYRSAIVVKRPWWKRLRCRLGVHGSDRRSTPIPHAGWHVWCVECGRDWYDWD